MSVYEQHTQKVASEMLGDGPCTENEGLVCALTWMS